MKPLHATPLGLVLLLLLHQQVLCQEAAPEPESEGEAEQRHLVVTSILSEPFLSVRDANATGNARFRGYIADLVAEVADILEFSYTIHIVLDGKYGQRGDDNKWTGMIGELINRDAGLAAAPLSITSAREQVVAFSDPWMNISLATLVPEGSGISSLQALADHEDMQYGTIDGGSTQEAFRSTLEELYVTMWSHMGGQEGFNVKSSSEGIKKVQDGNYSFILEEPMAEYYAHTECGVDIIEERFLPMAGYGLAMHPDGEVDGITIEDINGALKAMQEDGSLEELYEEWFRGDEKCGGSRLLISSLLVLSCLLLFVL